MKLKGILYYAVIVSFLLWCVAEFRADIAQIKFAPIRTAWDVIFLSVGLSLVNYLLRAIRWYLYLCRLGYSPQFGFSVLTYIAGFAFTLSPGKVGEMARGRYLQKVGVPLSSTAAAFFVERLMDLLAMVALACWAAASSSYDTLIWGVVITMMVLMLVLALAPWAQISEWVKDIAWVPKSVQKIMHVILSTLLSARVLLHPLILVTGFIIGVIAWWSQGVGLMVISKIPGDVSMDMAAAVGIYSVAVVVGALSFLPSGFGSTEAVMIALLTTHGYPISDAILLTLICSLVTLWFAVLIGWGAVSALRAKQMDAVCFQAKPDDSLKPLCVDLDGTLIHSDLLLESVLLLLKRAPLYFLLIPFWLLKGKAALKAEISKRVEFSPASLPYNLNFLDWLQNQRKDGRDLWLCTASNYRLAQPVAEHLQIFSGVLASTDTINLSGRNKAKQLVDKFGEKGFDYCGNHRVDLPIWQVSQGAVVVNGSEKLTKNAGRLAEIRATFPKLSGLGKPMLKALRLHQWAKNVLVFVPLAAAHRLDEIISVQHVVYAFFAFGFCASSVYVLNDMLDLEVDRQHPRKCKRPFASGDLSLLVGFALIPVLLMATAIFAAGLPVIFREVLAGYYLLTVAYSFGLKKMVLIDTITLAGLYTARIIAGAMAVNVPLSFWLLLFSVFLFFSLALVKRYAELDIMQIQGKLKAAGRGYRIEDLPILSSLGAASGYLCVLVLALYINSPIVESLYRHPQAIWLLCVLLLYWISRVWMKAHRSEMHDDPVVFALKDPISLVVGLLAGITVFIAI